MRVEAVLRRRAPELVIAALLGLLGLTAFLSWYWNMSSYASASQRADRLHTCTGEIHLGCEWFNRGYPQYFRSGLRLAVQEINEGLAGNQTKGVALANGEVRKLRLTINEAPPFSLTASSDPVAERFVRDPALAAVIDNQTDEWIGRTKAAYEAAGVLSISTCASFPGLNRSLRFSVATVAHDDQMARQMARTAPLMYAKVTGRYASGAGLLLNINEQSASWASTTFQTASAGEAAQDEVLALLRDVVARGLIDPDVPLQRIINQTLLPSEHWFDVINALKRAQKRLGSQVTARELLKAHENDPPPVPFLAVEEYFSYETNHSADISSIRAANVDYLVLADNTTSRVVDIIRELRRQKMMLPIFVSDNHQFERLAQELGQGSGDVLTLLDLDSRFDTERLRGFRDRYVEFLRAQGETVHEPGIMSLQGYEAVYLLKSVYEAIGEVDPLTASVALRGRRSPWPGKAISGYEFTASGDRENVRWHPLWLHDGKVQHLELNIEDE